MNSIIEKAIAPAVIITTWFASIEWRLRNKVSKDMYKQNNEDTDRRLGRGVTRFDNIDKRLITQGETLVKVHTLVEALAKKNGIK